MTSERLVSLGLCASWLCLTIGVYWLTDSLAVWPLSLGLALAIVSLVYLRALVAQERKKP